MRFFIGGYTWGKQNQLKRFINEGIWINGYEEDKYADLFGQISIGDMFALKSTFVKGRKPNAKSYLRIKQIGIVANIISKSSIRIKWFNHKEFDLTDIKWYANTLEEVVMGDDINRIFGNVIKKQQMDNYIELLKSNKNLILTGAPGTGKTFLAKQIAKAIIGVETDDELEKSGQFALVQFHPSYDYTDFVDGLRPFSVEDEVNIVFKIKDGIFKEFCKKALKAKISNEIDNFDKAWEELLSMVKTNLANGTLTKIGSWDYGLSTKDSLKYTSVNTPSQYSFTITKQNVYYAYQNIKARPSGAFQKDMEDIVEYMKQNQNLKDFQKGTISNETENNKYVFIIDEINRAEISKVFGELFFSIDPGYRGEKGKVKTQYANLQDADDVFANGLFVPENVYIIGTMNDIDRSVESMDFAMRRRFAWKEVKAEDRISMWDGQIDTWKVDALKRMNSLNKAIENIQGLGSAYHIGPAYFLKLENYYKGTNPFESLWNNHLEGVVFEYLRGLPDSEELMSKLKNAYNMLIDVEND